MNGTDQSPFYRHAQDRMVPTPEAVESAISQLAVTIQPAEKPEPVAGSMLDAAERSAQAIEHAAVTVEKLAGRVAEQGRELAGMIRKNSADYEKTVAAFADFTKQVTVAIQQAANDAGTFKPEAASA